MTVDRDAPPVIAEFFARQNNACIEAFRSREEGGKASVAAAGLPRNGSGGCLEDKMEEEEEEGAAVGVGSESLRSVPSLPPSRGSSGTGGGSGGGGNGAEASTNVISFSHFVPRQELCPEKRLLWDPQLTKVIIWVGHWILIGLTRVRVRGGAWWWYCWLGVSSVDAVWFLLQDLVLASWVYDLVVFKGAVTGNQSTFNFQEPVMHMRSS